MPRQTPLITGVYAIRHRDGRSYIGGSVDIWRRFGKHRNDLDGGKHWIADMQSAWNEDGAEAFSFEVLEECDECALRECEDGWIRKLKPQFNRFQSATGKGSVQSEEWVSKRVRTMLANTAWLERAAALLRERNRTPPSLATRMKMAEAKIGKRHHAKVSEEQVREIRSLRAEGVSALVLGDRFGISKAAVYDILSERTWASVLPRNENGAA